MIFTLHVFFTLCVMQTWARDTSPMCPGPITFLSSKEQRQVKVEILSLLEVEERPQKPPSKKVKYSTKFMMELYNVLSQDDINTNRLKRMPLSSRRRLRHDEIAKAEMSDVILSMNCVNRQSDSVGQRQKLAFSMKSVPKSATLVGAELKLYQNKKLAKNLPYTMYIISIYKPFQFSTKYSRMKKVGEKIASTDFTGWLSIDVTYMFNTWLEYRMKIQDLYVSVQPFALHEEKEINPASIGIIFQNKKLEKEPFIVAFLQANNIISIRRPRNIYSESRRINFMNILEKNDKCEMHTLKVSFKDLGWSDWVIAPDGYTAAFCHGTCNFPVKFPMHATNHALIQSLMHLKNPDKFPKPSCVPTESSQLSVLFKEKENNILKIYQNMIIQSCGCQ